MGWGNGGKWCGERLREGKNPEEAVSLCFAIARSAGRAGEEEADMADDDGRMRW